MTIGDFLVLLAVLGAYIAIMDRLASLQRLIEAMHPLNSRSPTLRAPVHAEQKCPACDGMGEINPWGTYYTCPECNGTGISNRSAGG